MDDDEVANVAPLWIGERVRQHEEAKHAHAGSMSLAERRSEIALEVACAVLFAAFCVFLFGGNALQRRWQQRPENGRRR